MLEQHREALGLEQVPRIDLPDRHPHLYVHRVRQLTKIEATVKIRTETF